MLYYKHVLEKVQNNWKEELDGRHMRNVENKKSLFAGVGADSKYRCNLCGHLTKSYGQRCPHCGTVASIYTSTDVTFDATSYR